MVVVFFCKSSPKHICPIAFLRKWKGGEEGGVESEEEGDKERGRKWERRRWRGRGGRGEGERREREGGGGKKGKGERERDKETSLLRETHLLVLQHCPALGLGVNPQPR